MENPILVTGAAGRVGAAGRTVGDFLRLAGSANGNRDPTKIAIETA